MAFSCKIVLAQYAKADGERQVYLQAIIDRKRAIVPLGFYIRHENFDHRSMLVKTSHANHQTFNAELLKAVAAGNDIGSKYRLAGKSLTPQAFIDEFKNPSSEIDLIRFIEDELKIKEPQLAQNTVKQHRTVINKLRVFKQRIKFGDLNPDIMREFKNHLTKKEQLSNPTVNKLLRISKQYIDLAAKRGHKFTDPFQLIKIKAFKSNRSSLAVLFVFLLYRVTHQ